MPRNQWAKLNELFNDARDLDPSKRRDFLRALAADDPSLEADVADLLQHSDATDGPLNAPAHMSVVDCLGESVVNDPNLGQMIGSYQIERLIGQGGFGDVYLASRTTDFSHKVAVKLLRNHQLTNDVVRRRFQLEQQVLADLDHECIAKLIDGGTTEDGRPYLIMECISGQSITDYCETCRLDLRQRLALFQRVCDAVAHAHHLGIVHRDIKPVNVLVTSTGVPKLVDFGIAKLTDGNSHADMPTLTQEGQFPFTPDYASPEQVKGEQVGPSTDVYSLGVVLYQLVTGARPYELSTIAYPELYRVVCQQVPARPSLARRKIERSRVPSPADDVGEPAGQPSARYRPKISRDLDSIVLTALRKEPERRYASAKELRDDIARHLEGKPIASQMDSVSYRLGKLFIRHRTLVTASLIVVLALFVGFIMTAVAWRRAKNIADRYHEQLYVSDVNLAFELLQKRRFDEVRRLTDRQLPANGSKDLRGPEWGLLRGLSRRESPLIIPAHEGPINEIAPVPGKPWIVSVGDDAMIRVWNCRTAECLGTMGPARGPLHAVSVSFDAATVATGCQSVQLWDLATQQNRGLVFSFETNVESLAFAPHGRDLAIGVRYRDVLIQSLDTEKTVVVQTDGGRHERLAFLPDGKSLVFPSVNDSHRGLRLWDRESQRTTHQLRSGILTHMAISCDGSFIAATSYADPQVHIYAANGRHLHSIWRECDGIVGLAFSPDDSLLAGACDDGTVVIWSVNPVGAHDPHQVQPSSGSVQSASIELKRYDSFRAEETKLRSIVFTEQRKLVTAGDEGVVKVWPIDTAPITSTAGPKGIGFSAASMQHQPTVVAAIQALGDGVWLQRSGDERIFRYLKDETATFCNVDISPSGDRLAIAKADGGIDLVNLKSLELIASMRHSDQFALQSVCFSHDGQMLASTGNDNVTCLWDLSSRQLLHRWEHRDRSYCVEFCPTSPRLAIGNCFREIQIVNVIDKRMVERIDVESDTKSLAWSSDGRWLAAGQSNGGIVLFDTTGRVKRRLQGHRIGVTSLTFSPDGRSLVSGSAGGTIRLWHVSTARALGVLHQMPSRSLISALSFSADGKQLFATRTSHSFHHDEHPILIWNGHVGTDGQ